jgi:hypothetical protein
MVTEIELLESPDITPLRFLFVGFDEDELLAWISDAAARIKECEDQRRKNTQYSHTSCKIF